MDENIRNARASSCEEEDVELYRDIPTKTPQSNLASLMIGNNPNIARVEPMPPPPNLNLKFLGGDDLDMLDELKLRAKATLKKAGVDKREDAAKIDKVSIETTTKKEIKMDKTLERLKASFENATNKRRLEDDQEDGLTTIANTKLTSEKDHDESEDQPLVGMLKTSIETGNKKQPPSKRLRTRSIVCDEEVNKDTTHSFDKASPNDPDRSVAAKSTVNPFDDEEEEEEEHYKDDKGQGEIICDE